MADRQERLGIVVYVEDQATGKLQKVKAEIAGMGPAGAAAGRGLATGAASIEKSSGRIAGALSHAKGAIGGLLSGPLGMLGLGAGLFTIGGAMSEGLSKAQMWGLQIEKLQGITHDSAEELSGLLAVTEKYGLSNERLAQIAGFTQKALGNLEKGVTDEGQALAGVGGASDAVLKAQERLRVSHLRLAEVEATRHHSLSSLASAQNSVRDAERALETAMSSGGASVGGADKFLKDYGFDIRDAKGNVKDFSTLLLTFSDYWNGNTNQGLKAAAAAKLFGRGYADLVPILNLGSKGIKEAEEEARALGLTLTQDNIVALAKAREATRQWGDALGGLELQLGLALLPQLTKLASWATSFVSTHGHDIVKFFTDAADFAGKAAGTIGDLVGAASAFWGSIPAPLRDLILKGIVADRTIHFLFGFSPIEAIGGTLLKGLTGQIFQRGSSPANPLFVSDITKGAGNLLSAGEGAAGAGLAGTALVVGLSAVTIAAIGAAFVFAMTRDTAYGTGVNGTFRPAGRGEFGIGRPIPPNPDMIWRDHPIPVSLVNTSGSPDDRGERSLTAALAANTATLQRADWLKKLEASWQKAGQTMHDRIKGALADLAAGRNVHGAASFIGSKLGNAGFGAGGYDQALAALTSLKSLHTSDPAVVRAIYELGARLPRLKTDKADLAAAVKIAESSDPKNVKLDKLNGLMADLKTHGDRTAQKKLSDIITAVKHQKPPHVTVNVRTVVPITNVDAFGKIHTLSPKTLQSKMSTGPAAFAAGGRFGPGVRLVGEEGPELQVDDRSGYIFNADRTAGMLRGRGARGSAFGESASGGSSALLARIDRLVAALEGAASRPMVARVSHRDMEAADRRRQAVGPSRARQFALSGG